MRHRRFPDVIAIGAILAAAFCLTYFSGQRGFYPFDQSIIFDGSYRILEGQLPYKDFVLPFGPVALWVQALFFKILGVTYLAYIVGAASVNVVAALVAMIAVRLLFPSRRWVSYAAGILTAVWFYPPFGTPWVDQTAFFFSLVGVCCLLGADLGGARRGRAGNLLLILSGFFAFLSFMSKQNVGSFMLPLYPIVLIVGNPGDRRRISRGILLFAVGLCASAGAFLLWVSAVSDFDTFTYYVLRLPSGLGRERLDWFTGSWFGLRSPFFGGRGPVTAILVAWGTLAVCVLALARGLAGSKRGEPLSRRTMHAILLGIYLVGFQHVFTNTTLNQPENCLSFIGIILAIPLGLTLKAIGGGRLLPKTIIGIGVAALVLLSTVDGINVAMTRKVHDIFRRSEFGDHLAVDPLRSLRWANPTRMGGYEITAEEVESLYRYLDQQDVPFFIFPDFTIMYGLVGTPSPQPLLWFHDGVTYRRDTNSDLDRWIVEQLKRHQVQIFVLEQVAWFNSGERLNHFPQMEAFLRSEYARIGQIGTFSIHRRMR